MKSILFLAVLAAALGTGIGGSAPSERELMQRGANRLIRTTDIPAVVALVERDGKRTIVTAGLEDIRRRAPARRGSRFWVGSITKAFVATVVMQLVNEGVVHLDDPLERWMPGRFPEGSRIQIRNLLNHTSGIREYMRLEPWTSAVARNPRVVIAASRLIDSAARAPLDFEPGMSVSYSNTNYLILGQIVEQATKLSLGQALRQRIFVPLRLTATAFESGDVRSRRPKMHGYDVSGARPVDVTSHTLGGPWADGALVSSAADLATFVRALLRGQLVPMSLVDEMATIVPRSHGEGLGLYRLPSPCGRDFYGHTGGTPGQVTFMAGTRDARQIFVVTTNGISRNALDAMGRYLDAQLCR